MPPFAGPIPPSLTAAPPNSGPATVPHGNPGNTMAAISKVREALTILQEALPGIPMGTEAHTAILKSVESVGKHMTEMANSPQMKMQVLQQMMKQAQGQRPNAALAALSGGHGGAPPPGGAGAPPQIAPPPQPPEAMAA